MSSLLQAFGTREYADNACAVPVCLNTDAPDLKKAKTLLKKLNDIFNVASEGKIGFILYGGALRDQYLHENDFAHNHIHDLDIIASVPEIFKDKNFLSIPDIINALYTLQKTGFIEKLRFNDRHFDQFREGSFANVNFNFGGIRVDLKLVNTSITHEMIALHGDATINAIAMNSDGNVLAHERLPDDAAGALYRCRVVTGKERGISEQRYNRFSKRPGRDGFHFEYA